MGARGYGPGASRISQVCRDLKWRCEYTLKRFKLLKSQVPRMMKHYARLGKGRSDRSLGGPAGEGIRGSVLSGGSE